MTVRTAGIHEWIDPAQLAEPRAGVVDVIRDNWWAVDARGRVCLYRWGRGHRQISPQCNSSRAIAEKLRPAEAVGTIKIPFAFLPHECGSR